MPGQFSGPAAVLRDKYLRDWTLLKRARFNAADRLARKFNASTYSLAIAGIFAFLLPLFSLQFMDELASLTKKVLDFTANITGGLSLVVGLIEQARDYPARARRFHECGLAVNSVMRDLSITSLSRPEELRPFIARYEDALEGSENHSDLDHDIARAQEQLYAAEALVRPGASLTHVGEARRKLARLKRFETFSIYWLYAIIWCVPPVTGVIIWLVMWPT